MSLKLEHVQYTYSPSTAYEIHALKDVNLEIPDGQPAILAQPAYICPGGNRIDHGKLDHGHVDRPHSSG